MLQKATNKSIHKKKDMVDNNTAINSYEAIDHFKILYPEFEQTLQLIPIACLIINSDGTIRYSNSLSSELLGYTVKEFLRMNFLKTIMQNPVNLFDVIPDKSTDNEIISFLTQGIKGDGKQIELSIDSRRIDNSSYLLLLKESVKLSNSSIGSLNLQQIIEKLQTPIVITDRSGNIEYANSYFYELTGYNTAEIIGKKTSILRTDYHSIAFYNDMWNTINSGKTWEGDFFNQKKSKEKYWQKTVIYPIRNRSDEIIQFLSVVSDITEYKRIKTVFLNAIIETQETASDFVQLNAREIECMKHICGGLSNKELAEKLYLSIKSIEGIKSKLMEKIAVKNTTGLIIWAIKNKVIEI